MFTMMGPHHTKLGKIPLYFTPPKNRPFQKNLTRLIFSGTVPLSPQKQSEPLSLVFECAYILASETFNEKDERYI